MIGKRVSLYIGFLILYNFNVRAVSVDEYQFTGFSVLYMMEFLPYTFIIVPLCWIQTFFVIFLNIKENGFYLERTEKPT